MKTKICDHCKIQDSTMFRISLQAKIWLFVCKKCCIIAKGKSGYVYGGTWKG